MTAVAFICQRTERVSIPHIIRQAEALVAVGYSVDIYAPAWPELQAQMTYQAMHFHRLDPIVTRRNLVLNLIAWIYLFITLLFAQLSRRYIVVQMIGITSPFVFATWSTHLLGAQIILDLTALEPEILMGQGKLSRQHFRTRLSVLIEQLCVDYVNFVIAADEPQRQRVLSRGCDPETISAIYHTPTDDFMNQPQVVRHPSVAQRFLLVAHVHADELIDYETMVRAISELQAILPSILLWIVCPPDHREHVRAIIQQYQVSSCVLVQTDMEPADIPSFIAQADGIIDATARDTMTELLFPPSLMEAMSLKVPAICVNTHAISYYFDSRYVLTFEQGNVNQLKQCIALLAGDTERRQRMCAYGREIIAQIDWSRERHRYVAIVMTIATEDVARDRAPRNIAGFSALSKQKRSAAQAYRRSMLAQTESDPIITYETSTLRRLGRSKNADDTSSMDKIPMRISTPSQEWRTGRQLRMRLGAFTLMSLSSLLLFSLPFVAHNVSPISKVIAALMFAGLALIMLIIPPGEAAIIVAIYFIAQRFLFVRFPPEGKLGPLFLYLGTALQLIIFAGFAIRSIVQQRPLMRSNFILWPASLYIVISGVSTLMNHVPLFVALLGVEHTLHNVIFTILIAEDLPTPQQLRRYVIFIVSALTIMASISITQTWFLFHALGSLRQQSPLFYLLIPPTRPAAVLAPEANTYAFLLNFGVFLALAMLGSLISSRDRYTNRRNAAASDVFFLVLAVSILITALFLTSSLENWIGLIVGLLALIAIFNRRFIAGYLAILATVISVSFIAYVPVPGERSTNYAQQIATLFHGYVPHNSLLQLSLKVIQEHFWLGTGSGRFGGTVAYITHSPVYAQYGFIFPNRIVSIDLFWLHIAGETGILGLLAFIALIILALRTLWNVYQYGVYRQMLGITAGVFAIVVATSVATFWGNALEVDNISAPFWALVGIGVALPLSNRTAIASSLPVVKFRGSDDELLQSSGDVIEIPADEDIGIVPDRTGGSLQ